MPTMNGDSRILRSRSNNGSSLKQPMNAQRPPPFKDSSKSAPQTPNQKGPQPSPPRTRNATSGYKRSVHGTARTPGQRVVERVASPHRPLSRHNRFGYPASNDDDDQDEFMHCDDLELDLSVHQKVQYHLCQGIPEKWGESYAQAMKGVNLKKTKWDFKEQREMMTAKITELREVIRDFVQRRTKLLRSAEELDQAAQRQIKELKRRSSMLREREDALEKEKHTLEEKIEDLSNRVGELTSEKADLEDSLRQEREKTAGYKEKAENEEQEKVKRKTELDEATANLSRLNSRITETDAQLKALKEERDSAVEQLANVQEEQAEKLRKERKEMNERLETMTKEHSQEAGKLKKQAEELQSELKDNKAKLSTMESKVSEYQEKIRQYETDISKMSYEKEAAEKAKTDLQKEVADLREQIQQRDNHVNSAMASITRMQETTYAREQQLQDQHTQLTERLQALQGERDELKSTETTLRGDLREKEGHIKEMTEQIQTLKEDLGNTRCQLIGHQSELRDAKEELNAKTEEVKKLERKIEQDSYEHEEKLGQFRYRAEEAEKRVKELEKHEKELKEAKETVQKERDEKQQEAKEYYEKNGALEAELQAMKESLGATKEHQMEKLCEVTREADNLRRKVSTMSELHKQLEEAEERAKNLEQDLFEGEMKRRKLHNYVQDLRGNIRVCVRIRPFLHQDAGENESVDDLLPALENNVDGKSLMLLEVPTRGTKEKISTKEASAMNFSFDNVFGPKATQKDVFNEVSELVQSALDGFNVCLFSYGQTGSGKTHTMQGSGSGEEAGLIPQSVLQILETIRKLNRQGWQYTLEASFLEIYNENLRDLLSDEETDSNSLSIVHQEDRTDVLGLEKVPISNASEVRDLLLKAARNRSTGKTNMNELSSRSHSVFTLYLRGEHEQKGICVNGNLNLCDLAGSERLDRSCAEGQRLKETQNINKSLSCLADVFTSLAKNASHVPFRNSKLTYLLQPCFKGNGKTMMLVNVSPTIESASETLCSLRFAQQVSQVHLGQAKKRITSTSVPGTEQVNSNGKGNAAQSKKPAGMSATSNSRKYATISTSKPKTPRNSSLSKTTPAKRGVTRGGSSSLPKGAMSSQSKRARM